MATIKIKRNDESINRLMAYEIYIDGAKAGYVSNEDTFVWKVPPGRHTLYARLDWLQSPPLTFDIADAETKTFEVSSLKNTTLLVVTLFMVVLFNVLRFLFNVEHPLLIILIFPAIFVLLYFLTIGRKKYLTIFEDSSPSANSKVLS